MKRHKKCEQLLKGYFKTLPKIPRKRKKAFKKWLIKITESCYGELIYKMQLIAPFTAWYDYQKLKKT